MRKLLPRKKDRLKRQQKLVADRIRYSRENMEYSQRELAKELNVKRERLASYETGRVPVNFYFANKFCARFGISQRWLATGESPQIGYIELPKDDIIENIRSRTGFLQGYRDHFEDFVEYQLERLRDERELERMRTTIEGEDRRGLAKGLLKFDVRRWFDKVPGHLINDYIEDFNLLGEELANAYLDYPQSRDEFFKKFHQSPEEQ